MQISDYKPSKNEELKKSEEALPRLKECGLEKVSRLYKAMTGEGCDGFHPKVPPECEFFLKVVQSGKWPPQTCTTMFFTSTDGTANGSADSTVTARSLRDSS